MQVGKQKLSEAPVLMHFNPKLPIILATDASSYGVGAVLSHIGPDGAEHLVAFASRSLSASERNYAQLEKEALSIIWNKAVHQYLYGKKFKLITDYKPLTTIFGPKSGVHSCQLQDYNVGLYIHVIISKTTIAMATLPIWHTCTCV